MSQNISTHSSNLDIKNKLKKKHPINEKRYIKHSCVSRLRKVYLGVANNLTFKRA